MNFTKLKESSLYILFGSFFSRGLSILSSVVLAWYLSPQDYGFLVLATIIAGFVKRFGSVGYEIFYLNNKDDENERLKILNNIFLLRIFTNLILGILIVFSGLYIINFNQENSISGNIIILFGFSFIFDGFNTILKTILKDQFNFKRIAFSEMTRDSSSAIFQTVFAILGFGGISFGIGPFFGSLVEMIYLKYSTNFKFQIKLLDFKIIKQSFNFGKNILFDSIIQFFTTEFDKILLNYFFSKTVVGYYGFSWGNSSLISRMFISPFGKLKLTYIAKYKKSLRSLFVNLDKISKLMVVTFLIPYSFGILFLDDVFHLVFPQKWNFCIILIKIFFVGHLFNLIPNAFMDVLTGIGKVRLNLKLTYFKAAFFIPALLICVYFSGNIIHYVVSIMLLNTIFSYIKLYFSAKMIDVSLFDLFRNYLLDFILLIIISFLAFYGSTFDIYNKIFVSISIISMFLFFQYIDRNRFKLVILIVKNYIKF